ncbi:YdeI/OmpD-associated family protein [Paenibacillus xerothermodurans]|uniref:YdeI/OmpD-associated family protein n=1 Tax=Paenibacillus xerothermodurans TaxID=1977292 RepID=UPI001FB1E40E|nr:YdeI/OmpD-associated family protein [Paenibacillus xerothermodurans]
MDVNIELDTEPRELTVPPDFSAALDRVPEARRYFDGLSYSSKSRFVVSIEGAKTAETRQRRIEKAVITLKESQIQALFQQAVKVPIFKRRKWSGSAC